VCTEFDFTKIEIDFSPVVKNKDFPMFRRFHGPGIYRKQSASGRDIESTEKLADVQIGINLNGGDL